MRKASLLSAVDLYRVHNSSKGTESNIPPQSASGSISGPSGQPVDSDMRRSSSGFSVSSSGGSCKKRKKKERRDSTAIGTAASIAAVALLVDAKSKQTEVSTHKLIHGDCEHSSCAKSDDETSGLLHNHKKQEIYLSVEESPSSSTLRLSRPSTLPRPLEKANSPLKTTVSVLDECGKYGVDTYMLQGSKFGSTSFRRRNSNALSPSFRGKNIITNGSVVTSSSRRSSAAIPLSFDDKSDAVAAMTCISPVQTLAPLETDPRSGSSDGYVPICHDGYEVGTCGKALNMNPESEVPRAMILDVGGRRHKVLESNFNIYPNTRLGKLVHARTENEILNLCDGYRDDEIPEYFFDRNWHSFNSILDIYRTGVLHLNTDLCALVLQKDLEYWQIDELILEPCCALKYYPEIEICVKEQKGEQESKRKEAQRLEDENFGSHCLGKVRTYLWNLFEYPETSKQAQVMAFTSLGVVLISTLTFVLGTFPQFQPFEESGVESEYPEAVFIMAVIDNILVGFFVIEYVVRFTCAPNKLPFFISPMNMVDLFAILPFFLDLIIGGLQDFQIMGKAGKIVRLVRVMRIMRIFKLVRHFAGLQSLIYTLNQAYKELGLLMLLVGVAVLTFSSLVYFAEKDNPNGSWSFLDSFWWGLMTLTTVGYGDLSPSTFPGKLIGGLCALGGIFILTLPIPIVVNSFASYYKNRLWRNEVAYKKRQRAKKRKEMELLMRDNLLNILTVPGTPMECREMSEKHYQYKM